ncbi:MAG: sporulation transcriptional regulator SpoIIID [Oscillospiraceae bacterium]|nr:sporulation transcriptional regulator SpoIIID [Oscillospiraceae bacterium]
MKGIVEERAVKLGEYIVENKATVRSTAKQFDVSKSTVHKDVSQRLMKINFGLFNEVKDVLEVNKAERHLRGGMATKNKYEAFAAVKNEFKG